MKKEIAKKWVRALRSKKYKQAKGVLKRKKKSGVVGHCCLGVLCEIYQAEQKKAKKPGCKTEDFIADGCEYGEDAADARVYVFEDTAVVLPKKVQRWAGLVDDTGCFRKHFILKVKNNEYTSLAEMNDAGCNFSTIATVIEEYAERL